jgi:hypothetical protein
VEFFPFTLANGLFAVSFSRTAWANNMMTFFSRRYTVAEASTLS